MRTILLLFGLAFFLSVFGQSHASHSVVNKKILPDSSEKITIGKIILKGNNITRDKIVLRELELKEGDVLSKKDFEKKLVLSRQNLLNRSLFNFVTFTPIARGHVYDVVIEMVERWYIWPIPNIGYADRNFNVWWQTKDFSRLDYGLDLRIENFRGRMELLNFIIKGGYDKTAALIWNIPSLNRKQTLGLSLMGGSIFNHETAVATVNNKQEFYKINEGYAKKWYFAKAAVSYRPRYRFLHVLSLAYNNLSFADSILILHPAFSKQTTSRFFTLKYTFKLDHRDYASYPLEGYYFDLKLTRSGLGIMSGGLSLFSAQSAFDQYFRIYKRWYFAYNFSWRLSTPKIQPYFLTYGLGLAGMEMRGYDLYFVTGQNMGLFKSNLKFEILPQKTYRLPWIKTEKFGKIFFAMYANLFFDMAYVSDTQHADTNPMANQKLWATGAGIDFVTYYDIVIQLYYAVNKQQKTGFFLSLVAPI